MTDYVCPYCNLNLGSLTEPCGSVEQYAVGDESDFELYYYIETKEEIPHWRKFFDDEDRKWINILEKLPAPPGGIEL